MPRCPRVSPQVCPGRLQRCQPLPEHWPEATAKGQLQSAGRCCERSQAWVSPGFGKPHGTEQSNQEQRPPLSPGTPEAVKSMALTCTPGPRAGYKPTHSSQAAGDNLVSDTRHTPALLLCWAAAGTPQAPEHFADRPPDPAAGIPGAHPKMVTGTPAPPQQGGTDGDWGAAVHREAARPGHRLTAQDSVPFFTQKLSAD